MHVSDLSPETRARLKAMRYDRIIEKHEGPEDWSSALEFNHAYFIQADGLDVLLSIYDDQLPNITITKVIPSADGEWLTLFLRDATFYADMPDAAFYVGRIAVCRRMEGEPFYVALVYHEFFDLFDPYFKQVWLTQPTGAPPAPGGPA